MPALKFCYANAIKTEIGRTLMSRTPSEAPLP